MTAKTPKRFDTNFTNYHEFKYAESVTEISLGLRGGSPGSDRATLIEAVVNTHVFNQQRHQYKQKNQTLSAFQDFTKLVPLLAAEATTL
jgi:hypothetical protein